MKSLFAIIAILTAAILAGCADAYVASAEEYLKQDKSVRTTIGDVKSLRRSNTIIVQASDHSPGYREYQFIVRGSSKKAVVRIQVKNLDAPAGETYLIKSIDHL